MGSVKTCGRVETTHFLVNYFYNKTFLFYAPKYAFLISGLFKSSCAGPSRVIFPVSIT